MLRFWGQLEKIFTVLQVIKSDEIIRGELNKKFKQPKPDIGILYTLVCVCVSLCTHFLYFTHLIKAFVQQN